LRRASHWPATATCAPDARRGRLKSPPRARCSEHEETALILFFGGFGCHLESVSERSTMTLRLELNRILYDCPYRKSDPDVLVMQPAEMVSDRCVRASL
jgi:hypothetical protein